jgi:hypothetical protein
VSDSFPEAMDTLLKPTDQAHRNLWNSKLVWRWCQMEIGDIKNCRAPCRTGLEVFGRRRARCRTDFEFFGRGVARAPDGFWTPKLAFHGAGRLSESSKMVGQRAEDVPKSSKGVGHGVSLTFNSAKWSGHGAGRNLETSKSVRQGARRFSKSLKLTWRACRTFVGV